MLPVLLVILGGAVATLAPAAAAVPPSGAVTDTTAGADRACRSKDAPDIVVCGQRSQRYRLDPSVLDASREKQAIDRSATSATPPAQAICASQPTGCGHDMGSLDLANVAIVAGTMAVRAAKGEDWARALRTGGPDEYQLYRAAKQRREAEQEKRAAAAAKLKAEEARRQAQAGSGRSN